MAFREALVNAVVHKDYSGLTPIQISIYDNKLMIYNDGELPEGWSLETLQHKHPSKPYNPAIAYVFFLAGYIESWGRGIEKIVEESRRFNGIIPQFRWQGGLWVDFEFNNSESEHVELGATVSTKLGEKLGEKLQNLSKNRKLIITLMKDNKNITISELSTELGISTTAIEKNISYLKENNFIKRISGDYGGHWEVIFK